MASKTIDIPAFVTDLGGQTGRLYSDQLTNDAAVPADKLIPASLMSGNATGYVRNFQINSSGRIILTIFASATGASNRISTDMSAAWEGTSGSLVINIAGTDYTVDRSDADTSEPYVYTGNTAIYTALVNAASDAVITLTFDDGANDTTVPTITGAETSADGAMITLTASEALDGDSIPAVGTFNVQVGGTRNVVTVVALGGSGNNLVQLTLTTAIAFGDTVTVAYTVPNANPIQDVAGNDLATFAARAVTNLVPDPSARVFPDTRTWEVALPAARYDDRTNLRIWEWGTTVASDRPEVPDWLEHNNEDAYLSALALRKETTGNNAYTVILHFEDNNTGGNAFSTTQDISSDFEATGWMRLNDGTNTWELSIANDVVSPVDTSEPYKFQLIPARRAAYTTFLQGLASSNQALTLTITDGVTSSDTTAPTLTSAATNAAGDIITLTFNEALDTSSVPSTNQFGVRQGFIIPISDVAITGSTVVLTLTDSVTSGGGGITVTYVAPITNLIQDEAGNAALNITNQAVTNNVPASATPTVIVGAATVNDATPTVGDTVTFTCPVPTGTATGAISYQWQILIGNVWNDESGATNRTLSTTFSNAVTITVRCVVTRQGVSATSGQVSATASAALTLNVAITPSDNSPTSGDTVTFTAALTGTATTAGTPGTPTYQWQQFTNSAWANISGETSATYDHTRATTGTLIVRCQATQQGVTANSPQLALTWGTAGDTTAPTFLVSDTYSSGLGLDIIFSEGLSQIIPIPSAFDVQVDANRATVTGASPSGLPFQVLLDVTPAITHGQTVTVAYTQPANATMERFSRGSVDGDETLTQFRARAVAANSQTYTPPDPITTNFAEPNAENYLIKQVFRCATDTQWTAIRLESLGAVDDAIAVFLVEPDGGSQIGVVRQDDYSSTAVSLDATITSSNWPDAIDGVYYFDIEIYYTEIAGGQRFDFRFGYTPQGGSAVAAAVINEDSTSFIDNHGIRDRAGNLLANFAAQPVTNNVPAALPNPEAGTVTITGDTTGTVGTNVTLGRTLGGTRRGTITQSWSVTGSGASIVGSTTGTSVVIRKTSAGNAVVTVTTTATGDGTTVASGTDTSTDTHEITFAVGTAITVPANQTANVNSGQTLNNIGADFTVTNGVGVTTYQWARTSGTSGTLSSSSIQRPNFTAPTLNRGASNVTIVFTVTATNNGVSDSYTVTITVVAPAALPTPEAGTVTITGDVNATVNTEVTLSANLGGTQRGSITYAWAVTGTGASIVGNTNRRTAIFTKTSAGNAVATVTVTATGDGTTIRAGTDTATDTHTIAFAERVITTTDVDRIYILGADQPSRPSGGTSDEDNLPSGWSRTPESDGTWTDNPQGPTIDLPFEWVAKGKKLDGRWEAFSDPALWSKLPQDGVGRPPQIIFQRTNSDTTVPALPTVTDANRNDLSAIITGTSWGTTLQGPIETARYVWISIREYNDEANQWGAFDTPVVWSRFGADGAGFEAIFIRNNNNTAPNAPTTTSTQDRRNDFVPSGWSDDPSSPTATQRFVWVSIRTKSQGDDVWSKFSTPTAWAIFGSDGAGAEFIFRRTNSATAPSAPTTTSTQDRRNDVVPSGWADNPPSPTQSAQYVYVSMRTRSQGSGTWSKFSTPALWARFGGEGRKAERATQGYVYFTGTFNSGTAPSTPSATSYNFATGAFTGLTTNWSTIPPTINAGTRAGVWSSYFTIVESGTYNAATRVWSGQTINFSSPSLGINLSGVVTFTSTGNKFQLNGADLTTVDGGFIQTNTITLDRLRSNTSYTVGTGRQFGLSISDAVEYNDVDYDVTGYFESESNNSFAVAGVASGRGACGIGGAATGTNGYGGCFFWLGSNAYDVLIGGASNAIRSPGFTVTRSGALSVSGAATFASSITATGVVTGSDVAATSDARLKTKLQPIDNALEKLQTLVGYTFDMHGERNAGLIAQDVQKVLPEAVKEINGIYTLSPTAILGIAVQAINELSVKLDDLAKKR